MVKKAKKGRRGACLQPGGSAQLSAPPQRDTGAEAPGESPTTPNKDCGEKGRAETPPPLWPGPPGESPGGAGVLHPQTMTGVSAGRAARTSTQTNKQGKKKQNKKTQISLTFPLGSPPPPPLGLAFQLAARPPRRPAAAQDGCHGPKPAGAAPLRSLLLTPSFPPRRRRLL